MQNVLKRKNMYFYENLRNKYIWACFLDILIFISKRDNKHLIFLSPQKKVFAIQGLRTLQTVPHFFYAFPEQYSCKAHLLYCFFCRFVERTTKNDSD